MKKSIIKIFVITVLLLQCLPLGISAQTSDFEFTYKGQTLRYTILDEEEKTCAVASENKTFGMIVIPQKANGYTVTTIASSAFEECDSLITVSLPKLVETIEDRAFSGCSNLKAINIPKHVKSIEFGVFRNCKSLTNITIPSSLTDIGNAIFYGCDSLISITVDKRNPNYSSVDGVLYNKERNRIIRFPAGKTGIFSIPNSVTTIGAEAFHGCSNLTEVILPNSIENIETDAFKYCI